MSILTIELETLNIYSPKASIISGFFELRNYNSLGVEFQFENGIFTFSPHLGNPKLFSKWNENEKNAYTAFFLNYFNEIKKINKIPVFTGHLKEEYYFTNGFDQFLFVLYYDQLSYEVRLSYLPESGETSLHYRIPIAINSEGDYGYTAINNILDKETIKRMWEPFRDKTKYRLQLLHIFR